MLALLTINEMTIADDIKDALREVFRQQLQEIQIKISQSTNVITQIDPQIESLQTQVDNLKSIKRDHQRDLNDLEKRLLNIQRSIQKLENGDIIIR